MDKQCRKCGAFVPSEYGFCNMCGSADFVVADAQPQVNVNQPQANVYGNAGQGQPSAYNNAGQPYGYQQMPNRQPWQNTVPQNPQPAQPYQYAQPTQQPKKKSKAGLSVGIIIALIIGGIIFAIVGLAVIGACVASEETSSGSINSGVVGSADANDNEKNVPYTKGSFDGTKYVNEWADIEFVLPEGYSDADNSLYAASQNETTDCGGYFMATEKGSFIYFCFEKLPAFSSMDEDDYLDVVAQNYGDAMGAGGSYKVGSTYYTTIIGGHTYKKISCEVTTAGQTFKNDMYVRKIDDYMVGISVVSLDSASNDALVKQITSVK